MQMEPEQAKSHCFQFLRSLLASDDRRIKQVPLEHHVVPGKLIQLKISFCGSICSLSVLSSRSVGGTD